MIAQPRSGLPGDGMTGTASSGRHLVYGVWVSSLLSFGPAFVRCRWNYDFHGVDKAGGLVVNAGSIEGRR
jgi:hypothetical protein